MNFKKRFFTILFLFVTVSGYAKDIFLEPLLDFNNKNYKQALLKLSKINTDLSQRLYLEGLCYARLENFDEAALKYQKSLELKSQKVDINYEYGQVLFALNRLRDARDQFKLSIEKDYKKPMSLYYMGYISQFLEEHDKAVLYYQEVFKNLTTDKRIRQVSNFQYANSLFLLKESDLNIKNIVKNEILPSLNNAFLINKKGDVAKDIKQKIDELKQRFELDPFLLKNGKRVPERPWKMDISQKVKYDSNVTLQTDLPTVQVANVDSFIYDTSIKANYRFINERQLIITPELKYDFTTHANRDNSTVYSNDSYALTPSLNTSFEHLAFSAPASFLLEIEHKIKGQDRLSQKDMVFASRYWQFAIGENFKALPIGPTTFKFKYKKLKSYSVLQDSITKTISLSQIHLLPMGNLLVYTVQADYSSVNLPASSTNNFLLRADYIIPKFWPKFDLNPYFSIAFLDTLDNREARGVEKTLTPGLKLTRTVNDNFKVVTGYSLQKKYSRDRTNFAYTKNEFVIDFKYKF